MKKRGLLLISMMLFLMACEKHDELIIVPKDNPFEVIPARFRKNVILEHFSDETQVATVENSVHAGFLQSNYGSRLILASFHRNDFLTISYNLYIANSLGGILNTSKGAVNRRPGSKILDGEDGLVWLSPANWEHAITQELKEEEAPLALAMETGSIDANKGFLNVYVAHKEAISGDTRLHVYMVEDNIQPLAQAGTLPTFMHHNVLKHVLTKWDGDSISLSTADEKGRIEKISFPEIDISNYNAANLKIIAFISTYHNDFRKRRVINAQEVDYYGVRNWDIEN
jgi:hypothetical protein